MDISQFNPGMELYERNQLMISRTHKRPDAAMQMPKRFIFSDVFPGWRGTEFWYYATRRMNAAFVMCRFEITGDGGTIEPVDNGNENFFYVLNGSLVLTFDGAEHVLEADGYAWIPSGASFEAAHRGEGSTEVVWVKKNYQVLEDAAVPAPVVGNSRTVDEKGTTAEYTKELIPASSDFGFDMSMDVQIYQPGVSSAKVEAHMSAMAMYILSGRGEVMINGERFEAHANDFFYVAPCAGHYALGLAPEPLYILRFEEVNREFTPEDAPTNWR